MYLIIVLIEFYLLYFLLYHMYTYGFFLK